MTIELLSEKLLDEEQGLSEEEEKKAEKILGRIMDKLELAEKFIDLIPLYYDSNLCYWIWDTKEYRWKIIDETDVLNFVAGASESNVINSKERTEILNAIKLVARQRKPQEIPFSWIQFGKQIIDITTGNKFFASSKYFVTNPIPHKLWSSPRQYDLSKFNKLFGEWVNPENVKNLYEILAFCMIPEYFIERIICLHGAGSNGKSVFRQMLRNFIGEKNVCSTSFKTLTSSRFEQTKLFKKLVCEMGETNLTKLEETEKIKRLVSGKDLVGGEFKNKPPFDFLNYAKLIISTNTLPPTDDKTDGFYRKWLIIDFPNQFEKEKDILGELKEEDYEALCNECVNILIDLLKNKGFAGEGTIKERRDRYEEKSNPFDKFYNENVDDSEPNADIPKWEMEKRLNEWLRSNKLRSMSDIMIAKEMRKKDIKDGRLHKEWFENNEATTKLIRCWLGLKWK